MPRNIEWSKIDRYMHLIMEADEDAGSELSLVYANDQAEFARLISAYPLNDDQPLCWMLEGEFQGVRGFLALGTDDNCTSYLVCGCPTSAKNCCLLSSKDVKIGISLLAADTEIKPPWQ